MGTNESYIQPFAGVKASELCTSPADLMTSVSAVCTIGCDREEAAGFVGKVLMPNGNTAGDEIYFTVEPDGTLRLIEQSEPDVEYKDLCDILEEVS